MRKLCLIVSSIWLCAATSHEAGAQNLVLNPSFENVNLGNLKCSWYLDNSEFTPAIANWDMPTGGSTDIFHTSLATSCFCSPYSTDPSAVGSQTPRTGSSMTALVTYGSGGCTPYREYVQGQLSSALVPGTTYKIEMYVSLADYSNRATNNIGIKFLTSRYSSTSMCVWSTTPDANYTGTPISDKTNWTKISFCYTPTASNLLYFAIGNFYNDASTTASAVSGSQGTIRYFLDDVSIVASSAGAATASASGAITCANNTVNLSTNVASASYTWSAPAGSSILSGINSQSATGQGGGTYTVTINDPNSCGAAVSTAVVNVSSNTTPPGASASSGGALTCATTNVTLSGSPAGMTYGWSGPGIVSGGGSANPVVNQPGTYNLTVTNPSNGCSSNTSISVSQNTTPPGASASSGGALTCASTNVTLSGSPAGMTYGWSGPGIVSGGSSANPVVNQPGTYNLTVTNPSNGCSSNTSVSVSQNTTPPGASASSGGALTCASTNVTLSGSPAGMSYGWSGPGIVSGGSSANPVVNQPGTYNLTVTNPSNGCSSNTSVSVSQNTTPPGASASASGVLTCTNTSMSLTGTSTSGTSYSWSGPGIVSGANTANPVINQPGTYNLTVTGSNGCTSTAAVTVSQNTSLPNVTASSGSTVTCVSNAVSLSVSPAGLTYTWSAAAGSSITGGANAQTATASGPGPYTVAVYNPSNGCSATVNVSPTINNTPPPASANAGPGVLTCTSPSLTLSATSSGGMTYSWSGPGIVSGGSTANPVVNQPGTYNLTVTNPTNGCTANTTAAVSQNTVHPTVAVGPATYTTTCASPTVQLTATSSTANVSYSWQVPPTGSLNNNTVASPVASGTGIFTVVVTNTVNGCSSSTATSQVFADAAVPSLSLSASSLVLTCATTTVGVSASASGSNLSYSWTPSPASGGTTANPVFNNPGSYAVVVTNTVNGCSTNANLSVTTNTTTPTVSVSPTQTITCGTSTAVLTATSNASSTYTWTGAGISGASNAASVTVNQAGSYSVVVTDNANGCTTMATGTVVANMASPSATLLATSSNTSISCVAPTVTLSVTSTPSTNVTYNWSTGGSGLSAGIASPGVVTVTVTNMANGCETTAQFNVTGNIVSPVLSAATSTFPCTSSTVALHVNSNTPGVTYLWTGPMATSIVSGGTTASPVGLSVGVYTVVVTDPSTSCSTTQTVSVVQGTVTAAFTADPTSGISPLSVNFTNQSTGAVTYSWDFGNGNTSSAVNPSQVFTGTQTYTVMLVASAGTCTDVAYATIVVDDDLGIEIPNVFTPNGDGTNDVFYIKSTGVKEIELQIFNRWGQKLYTFGGSKASWDGMTGQGDVVPDGTYFFFVKATGFNGKVIEKQGTVTLLR